MCEGAEPSLSAPISLEWVVVDEIQFVSGSSCWPSLLRNES